MSPLAKEVIEKLSHEDDEPSNKEIKLIEEYKNSKEKLVSFDDLVRELDLADM